MARGDGIHRTNARNMRLTAAKISNAQQHNEREKESYVNQDIVPERTHLNVHFKKPTAGYAEMFEQLKKDGIISTRGLKEDAVLYGELVFDVNTAYFHNHGGYDFAKQFYTDAYKSAIESVGGEQYILSAVMHADERNRAMSDALGQDVYSSDYEVIGKLKQFADRHGVCILIVHHTRKQPAGDSFEKISGTTGLSGCADGALIMQKEKRTDGKATLEISGRDQPDQRLYLSKDQERLVWLLDHAENELWKQPPDPVLEAVAKIVSDENREWEGSPTELAEALRLDMAVNRLTKHLNVNASRLLEEHQVKYEYKIKHEGRRIRLTYVVIEAPMLK